MFNFFSKTDKTEDQSSPNHQDQVVACISYYLTKSSDVVNIDISINDCSDDSINSLCDITDVLSTQRAYIETVEIIKNSLIEEDNEEALIRFLTHVGTKASETLFKKIDEYKNQPCIRPSDMLR